MRTGLFIPSALFASAAMIGLALKPGWDDAQNWRETMRRIEQRGFIVDGEALEDLEATLGTGLDTEPVRGGRKAIIRAYEDLGEGRQHGVLYTLTPAVAGIFEGRKIEITLTVRTAEPRPSSMFAARFFMVGSPQTEWRRFEPGEQYEEISFEVTPPKDPQGGNLARIAIWPDVKGDGGGIDIVRIRIRVLD